MGGWQIMTGSELQRIDHAPAVGEVVTLAPDRDGVWRAVRRPARRGMVVLGTGVLCFVYWAFFAVLDGGAIAPGVVSPDGSKRTIQHLEGGIIAKLNVKDGDTVSAGQALVELDSLQARAAYDIVLQDYRAQLATRVRLEAEKTGAELLDFPAELSSDNPETLRLVAEQRNLFTARLELHNARRRVLTQRKLQLTEQMRGYDSQVESTTRQLELIVEELKSKDHLLDLKLIPRLEVLKVERAKAEIGGRLGEFVAARARAQEQVGETDVQLLAHDGERREQIAAQLEQVRAKLAEIEQKLQASRDVLDRTVIKSPIAGTVHNLKFKTVGGVVLKGEPIVEIVPLNDMLLIDARVSPHDIDVVRAGLPAMVHLTAYTNRGTPKVRGTVRSVSADRVFDEGSRLPYFLARVQVEKAEIDRLTTKVDLVPGMPAEALIVTERRTLIRYLLQPFLDAWRRSFREV
jgi:HlyD family secretion protein/epimerase transport system membrane fusion protein